MKNEKKLLKNRCRKSDAKNIGKSSKKASKIDAKTIKKPSKKRCGKKVDFWKLRPDKPGPPQAPTNTYKSTRHIRPLKETHMS